MLLGRLLLFTLLLSSISTGRYHGVESEWRNVYNRTLKFLPKDFVLTQLAYFGGWRQHQSGTYENLLLAGKQLKDWREWGWPIVETVNFTVRLARGPSAKGPWNEVVILSKSTQEVLHRAQNNVTFKCTDRQPHGNATCSSNTTIVAPAYCQFARAGNATGHPVFVNYALLTDLTAFTDPHDLCTPEVIVIARHGYSSYGSKVRNVVSRCRGLNSSELPGGMIIYREQEAEAPDVKVYPDGIGLPPDGILFRNAKVSQGQGDPETPAFPSIDGVYKTEMLEDVAITPFPVQMINYRDVQVVAHGMGGKPIPKAWKPSVMEFVGPQGDNLIRMDIRNRIDEKPSTLVNVIGIIPGEGPEAEKYVILGNHRDAWVQGASDPHSGTVVLQGLAYLLGLAYREGWRPRRSILLVSWDAEEIGLIGSTEFTELYRDELLAKAVVYFNQDCPVKGNGRFFPRTDEFLEKALLDSAKEVHGPCNTSSFFDEWTAWMGRDDGDRPQTVSVGGFTDHVPFQFHLGIPSTYPEFRPAEPYFEAPSYHTAYDSVDMAVTFTDPPCCSNDSLLPLHHFLIRYHFHLLLKFSSSRRLPIHPVPKAITMKQSWEALVEDTNRRLPDFGPRYGINLDGVTGKIEDFLKASKAFEDFYAEVQLKKPKCLHIYNDILGRLSKHFIFPLNAASSKSVLFDSAKIVSHRDTYFHSIRTLISKFYKNSNETSAKAVKELKIEISILVTAFTSASNLLRGGLLGSLDMLNAHFCPPH